MAANTELRVRIQKEKRGRADIQKDKLLGALEKMRDAVRTGFKGGDQVRMLNVVDQIQEKCLRGELEMESFMSNVMESRGQTRRNMKDNPSNMVRLLNSIDTVEEELTAFVHFIKDAMER